MKGPTKRSLSAFLILSAMLNLTSCANMFASRTFIDEMEHDSDNYWVPGQDFALTAGDSGRAYRTRQEISQRTPASDYQKQSYQESESIRRELMRRENALSEREFASYREAQSNFTTDSERIYYLNLSPYEREIYLRTKNGDASSAYDSGRAPASLGGVNYPKSHQMDTLDLIQPSVPEYGPEINMGMAKDQVLEMWGRPMRIDVAGDPRHENERWSFQQNGQVKTVYFENGQVQGWSLR